MSDIEGKAAREAVSECGQRASFNWARAACLLCLGYGAPGEVFDNGDRGSGRHGREWSELGSRDIDGKTREGEGAGAKESSPKGERMGNL